MCPPTLVLTLWQLPCHMRSLIFPVTRQRRHSRHSHSALFVASHPPRLWEYILTFLAVTSIRTWHHFVADVCSVAQAFAGNLTTCLRVQSRHIDLIVKVLTRCSSDVPQLLQLLHSIVKVSGPDVPLRRNQSFVMKCIMKHFSRTADFFNQSKEHRSPWRH